MSSAVHFHSTPDIYNYHAFESFKGMTTDTIVPETTWALDEGKMGATNMCFSKTVDFPILLLSSVGHVGYDVTLSFSEKYKVLYDGGGMNFSSDSTLIGSEGNAVLVFPEGINCVTIKSSRPEVYTNVSWALNISLFKENFLKWLLFIAAAIVMILSAVFWRKKKNKKKINRPNEY